MSELNERERCLELVDFHFWEAFINPPKSLEHLHAAIIKSIQGVK